MYVCIYVCLCYTFMLGTIQMLASKIYKILIPTLASVTFTFISCQVGIPFVLYPAMKAYIANH